ncbi:MAG: DUF2796 domain-containing protein [Xanthomonadaceae bacterium]|nr:DUF2796 domain-containing protein [Xanthomonadaceae bacterium]
MRPYPAALLALLLAQPAWAQHGTKTTGVHQHAVASGQLAVDGSRLQLDLIIPGANLVGFEHPPQSPAQRQRLSTVLTSLEQGAWLRIEGAGKCRAPAITIETPGFRADAAGRSDDSHPDPHEHENAGHFGADSGHAEFHVRTVVECPRGDLPGWIEIELFEDWPANRRIRLDVLTDSIQRRDQLDGASFRVPLK